MIQTQRQEKQQHASRDEGCAIRTRMLRDKREAKVERGISFSKLASLAKKN